LQMLSLVTLTAALLQPNAAPCSRRAVLAGTFAGALPLSASAFDLPPLEEYDNPKARKAAAARANPGPGKQQSTAFYAVSTGDLTSLEAMVQNGWDLTAVKDSAGKTVLHRAAQVGNAPAVALLLKSGSPVDPQTQWKETPLHMAARTNRLDVVKLLVEAGASVSKESGSGDTALALAQKYKYAAVAEYLAGQSK